MVFPDSGRLNWLVGSFKGFIGSGFMETIVISVLHYAVVIATYHYTVIIRDVVRQSHGDTYVVIVDGNTWLEWMTVCCDSVIN